MYKWTTPFSINGDLLQKAFLLYVFVGICSGIGMSYEFYPDPCLYLLRKGSELAPSPREKEKLGRTRINCAYPLPRTRVRSVSRGEGELCGSWTTMTSWFEKGLDKSESLSHAGEGVELSLPTCIGVSLTRDRLGTTSTCTRHA